MGPSQNIWTLWNESTLHFIKIIFFFPRGDESDYSEDDLNMNRSDESGSSASRVEPEPVMTIYQEDSLVEQFGSSTDQTEEFSDENKSIVWFLVKQVSILFIEFLFLLLVKLFRQIIAYIISLMTCRYVQAWTFRE